MKSLDQKLGELVTEMTPQQIKEYRAKTKGGETIETLCNIAESVIEDFPSSSSRNTKIRRNNGASGQIDEASAALAESDRLLNEAIASRDPDYAKAVSAVKEVATAVSGLTESQRKEYEFCLMLQMSEADALKVARLS